MRHFSKIGKKLELISHNITHKKRAMMRTTFGHTKGK